MTKGRTTTVAGKKNIRYGQISSQEEHLLRTKQERLNKYPSAAISRMT